MSHRPAEDRADSLIEGTGRVFLSLMRYTTLVTAALVLVSCNRDPQHLKQAYLKRGNDFFRAGKNREAGIYYRKAIEQDRRFGEAWYHLALIDLKNDSPATALRPLYVSVELLKPGTPESRDAILKLSEILVTAAEQTDKADETDKRDALINEVRGYENGLEKQNSNSWEARRLHADLEMLEVRKLILEQKIPDAKRTLAAAISDYRAALAGSSRDKPGDYSVSVALSRALIFDGQLVEGEAILTALTGREKQNRLAYMELYQLYDAENRLPQSEAVLKEAIQNIPQDARLSVELARFYLLNNKTDDLLKLLSRMKSDPGQFPDAFIRAGDFFRRAKRPDEAIKQYEEGISKDPGQKLVYLKYEVEVYLQSGGREMARIKNEEILKIDARDPEGRAIKARLALEKGEYSGAAAELQSVVTSRPMNPTAHFDLGRAYLGKGDIDQARLEFDKAVQLSPGYLIARVAQAEVALLSGDAEGAVHDADDLLHVFPDSVEGVVMKGEALRRERKFEEARGMLEPALRKNPGAVPLMLEVGAIDRERMMTGDAIAVFRQAYEVNPQNIRGLLAESSALLADRQIEKSIEVVRAAVRTSPDRVDLQTALGNAQAAAEHFQDAIATYQALLARLTDHKQQTGLLVRIGQAYRSAGDPQHSAEAFERSRHGQPDNPVTIRDLGRLYAEMGRNDVAKRYYERALKLDPSDPLTLNSLAWLLAENNGDLNEALARAESAKEYYERDDERARKNEAIDPLVLRNLAAILAQNGRDLSETISFTQYDKQGSKEHAQVTAAESRLDGCSSFVGAASGAPCAYTEIADTIGWIYLKKNLTNYAIESFRSIVVDAPGNPVYRYHYAMALNQKGERESARKECQAALADKPTGVQEDKIRRLLANLG